MLLVNLNNLHVQNAVVYALKPVRTRPHDILEKARFSGEINVSMAETRYFVLHGVSHSMLYVVHVIVLCI